MNRTIKDATIKVFHYPDLDSLKEMFSQLRQAPEDAPMALICATSSRDQTP